MPRTGPLADLSGLQLVAGALAAMTSAWMASWLGVAGTLIGAAVGSIVAGIATALYRSSLERGVQRSKTLLTDQGSVIESTGDDTTSEHGSEIATAKADPVSWKERLQRLNWRSIALVSGATLLAAVVIIGVYEVSTGKSYGNSSNPTIVPVSSSGGGAERTPAPAEEGTEPSADPTSTAPTQSAPTTQAPTATSPTTAAPTTQAPTQPPQPNEGGESAPAE
ncbi:hypothetical protein BHE97_09280 [Aeromicrobium sp. PE09-221]|uniref:hypothetical protein n=1 Tax=Aeromicrobium sp. PE09-221 TaxID=1898043 RepID=UPI000B3E4D27|nr:hypothetical protein [Aeromicrobium sp. PE09-221]OUZ09987.1 hypothetical protein BHE97_09280 [Aeromicrobium sp. PE09-221]